MKSFLQHLATSLLLGVCLHGAHAGELEDNPGYLNLERIEGIAGRQPSVEVTLTGPVLKMLLQLPAQFNDDDPEAAQAMELLKVIDQILVRVYPMDADRADDMLSFINDTSASLEGQNWSRIVRVREEGDSNVDIHVRLSEDGENLNGLAIMAVELSDRARGRNDDDDDERDGDDERDPGDANGRNDDADEAEVVFVNIVGNFNPAYLANIGEQFDIDYLDDVDEDAVSGATAP